MNLYTIPAQAPFLHSLANWLLSTYGDDPVTFTGSLLLLPNRRSCRALRDAFLDCAGGKPTLLPRILPIQELDEEALLLPGMAEASTHVPPAISPVNRQLLLTQLIMELEKAPQTSSYNIEQAARLASELAKFFDEVTQEGLDFTALDALVPQDLAIHWQQTLDFLKSLATRWPEILRKEGAIDAVERRNRLLKETARTWQTQPLSTPIIAAGITSAAPAVLALLASILQLPAGKMVLPGLDCTMPEREWEQLQETHPQYGMKQLLLGLGAKRGNVMSLAPTSDASLRVMALTAVLQPAEATATWLASKPPLHGLRGITCLNADTSLDEARMIAIALREALETSEKTAALITPDRNLARMVVAQMGRFGIAIDDSTGQKLVNSTPACFLRLSAEMIAQGSAPLPLLAALRHPMASGDMETPIFRSLSRTLELQALRGLRLKPGLAPLLAWLRGREKRHTGLEAMIEALDAHAQHFAECFRHKTVALQTLLDAHIAFAEWLASSTEQNGGERLWAGEAGNALAEFLTDLRAYAGLFPAIQPQAYIGLLEALLAESTWRPRYGLHPRLHILGQLEARLQRFDLVILGGLNEGTWPPAPAADPWMSRPMRKAFGLSALECAIGESAHDFFSLSCAKEVLLTRATKVEGTPTIPSRWLTRLETITSGLSPDVCGELHDTSHFKKAKELLDAPAVMLPLAPPAPIPPLSARPRRLRVTEVDTLMRDPYKIYAAKILKLRALDALDQEPDAADFGSVVHKALELFTRQYPAALSADAYVQLLNCGKQAFAAFLDRPAVAALWWPRFEAMAEWVVAREAERRVPTGKVMAELNGEWRFDVNGKPFDLATRIDRLEIKKDGTMCVADYKTGMVPKISDIQNGLANQLPLMALIMRHGSIYPPIGIICTAFELEYWKLAGNAARCAIKPVNSEIVDKMLQATHTRLIDLICQYDDPTMSYAAQTNPALLSRYNDYAHLTRMAEWENA